MAYELILILILIFLSLSLNQMDERVMEYLQVIKYYVVF